MALLPVEEAKARILARCQTLGRRNHERWRRRLGRVLARDHSSATRDQPPFAASAMDGYAVRAADVAIAPARSSVIGIAPAGHAFSGQRCAPGEAVRIFTGAPMPARRRHRRHPGEYRDATASDVIVNQAPMPGPFGRGKGPRFRKGDTLAPGRHPARCPRHRPCRGDELGIAPCADDSRASRFSQPAMNWSGPAANRAPIRSFPPTARARCHGRKLSAASRSISASLPDNLQATDRAPSTRRKDADILVTTGGASVGDHDFVQRGA